MATSGSSNISFLAARPPTGHTGLRRAIRGSIPRKRCLSDTALAGKVDLNRALGFKRVDRLTSSTRGGCRQALGQVRRRPAALGPRDLLGRTSRDDVPALVPGPGAEVDDPV